MPPFNALDFLVLVIVAVSVATALSKGLSGELLSLAGVVAGFLLAVFFYPRAASLLQSFSLPPAMPELIGFLGIFLTTLGGVSVATHLTNRVLKTMHLKWIDRLLGGVFGLVRGWLIAAVLFLALTAFPVRKEAVAESRLADFFLTSAYVVSAVASSELKEKFQTGYPLLRELWIKHNDESPAKATHH